MRKFKIEYRPQYTTITYCIYRKDYKYFGLIQYWEELTSFATLEEAETALRTLKLFPKYYEI